ncbi:PREDICTED: sepiapterin reductase [Polistes dominula]|uniref:Sepiapterin reductase n=1 Tax=Polistes dominula TaxID=743375 RepID=A0ABM1INW3_POLDO|nr:PREDICTED: sepiapterin reductase [Polistes dominula]
MSIPALSGKAYFLITGASRGIGKQIAISFGSLLQEGSYVLLLASNLNALKDTAAQLPSNLNVDYASVDLGTATKDDLKKVVMSSLKGTDPKEFDRVIIVHNVGTSGDVSKFTNEMMDINVWRKYFDLNMFIPIILNGLMMEIFDKNSDTKKLIINITSLLAQLPFASAGYYCTVKAAKEMFFKVFALEYPEVDVLNYSPGPVQTDMLDNFTQNLANKEFKSNLISNTILTTEQTVNRLIEVLKDHQYKSGDHIDYFDEKI